MSMSTLLTVTMEWCLCHAFRQVVAVTSLEVVVWLFFINLKSY